MNKNTSGRNKSGRDIKRSKETKRNALPSLAVAMLMLAWLCAGCSRFPQDPHNSLNQVLASGVLRVGAITNPPWVTGAPPSQPGGVEAALITSFADDLGVRVEWRWGPADALFTALANYELDVVIGGITEASPWLTEVAFTVPYYTSHVIVGMPPAVPVLTDLRGVAVVVRTGSDFASTLANQGATVIYGSTLSDARGVVAAEEWEVDGLGLQPTPIELKQYEHVLAIPQGENGLLMRLENFLLAQTDEAAIARQLWAVDWQ